MQSCLPRRLASCVVASVWMCSAASVACAGTPQAPGSTEPTRTARVAHVNSNIAIDGVLSEPLWDNAPTMGDLIQREPHPGDSPTEKTEVKLLYDAHYLYIGVTCYDSEPRQVIGTQMARDSALQNDDRIEILLDTFRDRRNAFYFATNPAGALVDGLVSENGQLNLDWDTIWNVRTRRTSQGWTAEFAIPFKSLSFPSGRTTWGFNLSRTIKRKIEEDRWSGARLELAFFQVSEAGEITDLENVTQGIGLDIRPFGAGRWLHGSAHGDDTITGKPGVDAFYNITPSLKLSVTANTDFGETEVDARQINLTRFPLFFPEKRSFFLENAGIFNFSNTAAALQMTPGTELIPFFSRRIGLLSGQEVPILFGAKLTGKVGRTDVGVLQVRTRASSAAPAKDIFVGRMKQNLLRQSYIGALFTHGDPALPSSSNTFGGDVRLATSRFLGKSQNIVFNAFGVKSKNDAIRGKDWAYGFSAEYPNDLVKGAFVWREVQQNFRPALGFAPRTNVRLMHVGGEYDPRPKDFLGVRQFVHEFSYSRSTRLDNGQVESWKFFLNPVEAKFNSGEGAEFNWVPTFERLFAPFEISPGVVLPPGDYQFTRWRLIASSATKRRLEAQVTWWLGAYWSGHADEIVTLLRYKIPPRFVISFSMDQTFARLNEGSFVARIFIWRVNYSASPFLSFSNLIQYDNESRDLGWQSRVRWILRPGNDLFLVFSQGWIQEASGGFRFRADESKVSTKFQYTFRF